MIQRLNHWNECVITVSCRWPQNLAEQISLWRPKLPGGCKLCVCAHWPLLKRATAGLLLNVISRGLHMPLVCSCSLHSGGRTKLNEVWTWYSHVVYCAQNLKKIKKIFKKNKTENPHTRRESSIPTAVLMSFSFILFRCFQGLQKIKIKTSYLNKGTEVGMHDQCHRLNNLILTFLANFVKG